MAPIRARTKRIAEPTVRETECSARRRQPQRQSSPHPRTTARRALPAVRSAAGRYGRGLERAFELRLSSLRVPVASCIRPKTECRRAPPSETGGTVLRWNPRRTAPFQEEVRQRGVGPTGPTPLCRTYDSVENPGFQYRFDESLGGAGDGPPGDDGPVRGDADGSFTTTSVKTFSPFTSL